MSFVFFVVKIWWLAQARRLIPMSLEAYFAPFRANIIGINQDFESPFGRQRII